MQRSTLYATVVAGLIAAGFLGWTSLPRLREARFRDAGRRGDGARVLSLLRAGISPDLPLDASGETVLMRASSRGDLSLVEALLLQRADPARRDAGGRTALARAVAGGHQEVIRRLLATGADVGQDEALVRAVMGGRREAASLLLQAGANPNTAGGLHGETALLCAVSRSNPELVRLLLASGADPNLGSGLGETPLQRLRALPPTPARGRIGKLLAAAGAR